MSAKLSRLFGVSGKFGSGKSEFFKIAKEKLSIQFSSFAAIFEVSFASELKRFISELYNLQTKKIDLNTKIGKETFLVSEKIDKDHFNKLISSFFNEFYETQLNEELRTRLFHLCNIAFDKCKTWGEMLQEIGTTVFRKNLDEDAWVNLTSSYIKKIQNENPISWVFVTDCRFKNEFEMLKKNLATIIRIEASLENRQSRISTSRDPNHISETDLDNETRWNIIIINDGTLQEFREFITQILKQHLKGIEMANNFKKLIHVHFSNLDEKSNVSEIIHHQLPAINLLKTCWIHIIMREMDVKQLLKNIGSLFEKTANFQMFGNHQMESLFSVFYADFIAFTNFKNEKCLELCFLLLSCYIMKQKVNVFTYTSAGIFVGFDIFNVLIQEEAVFVEYENKMYPLDALQNILYLFDQPDLISKKQDLEKKIKLSHLDEKTYEIYKSEIYRISSTLNSNFETDERFQKYFRLVLLNFCKSLFSALNKIFPKKN